MERVAQSCSSIVRVEEEEARQCQEMKTTPEHQEVTVHARSSFLVNVPGLAWAFVWMARLDAR